MNNDNEMSLDSVLDMLKIEYEKIKSTINGTYTIDEKYYAKPMKDGRWVIVELGEQLFPPRGKGSVDDLFTNVCKFAKWKWVVKGNFVKEWPANIIDESTGDVVRNEEYY